MSRAIACCCEASRRILLTATTLLPRSCAQQAAVVRSRLCATVRRGVAGEHGTVDMLSVFPAADVPRISKFCRPSELHLSSPPTAPRPSQSHHEPLPLHRKSECRSSERSTPAWSVCRITAPAPEPGQGKVLMKASNSPPNVAILHLWYVARP